MTSMSYCPSCPEPLAGEGLCHDSDFCGSLRRPPEGTLTWVLTFPDSISHTPRTWTNHLHRCSSFTALLKQPSHSHSLLSLVLAEILSVIPVFCDLPVYDSGLFTSVNSLLPALVVLLLEIPIVLLPALTPAWYCLRLCLASDIPDTVVWSLPVWPCLSLLKWDCKWIHMPQTLLYRMWECVWKKSDGTLFVIHKIFISNCNLITRLFLVSVTNYNSFIL